MRTCCALFGMQYMHPSSAIRAPYHFCFPRNGPQIWLTSPVDGTIFKMRSALQGHP